MLKSTPPLWGVLVPSSSLKIVLSDVKDKMYEHGSGYYGFIIGWVVVTLGCPSRVPTSPEEIRQVGVFLVSPSLPPQTGTSLRQGLPWALWWQLISEGE